MHKRTGYKNLVLAAGLIAATPGWAGSEMKCIQRPTFWLVGQQTRIVIQTPADCGKLTVTCPPALELFARRPHSTGDTEQRFYFRARQPLASGRLTFASGKHRLALPVKVMSWGEALQPRTVDGVRFPRVFPLEGKDEHKPGISFLKPEVLTRLRKRGAGSSAQTARTVAALPRDHEIFHWLPETTIPRAVFVTAKGRTEGCPICGRRIYEGRSPFYPWKFDFENHPYQVQCPVCERWFPDNKFGDGDVTSGPCTDDGWGYTDGEGTTFCFVAYYNCWHYLNRYVPLVTKYADLYARTGQRRIGRAAALALFRIAEQYLNLALNINQRKAYMRRAVWRGQIIPQGIPRMYNSWLYVEHNWECPKVPLYAEAFEMIWDYFDGEDPEFLGFLQDNHHPEIRTMHEARHFIEAGYFRVVAQSCLDRTLIGNHPQAQRAAMEAVLFLNTPRSKELVDWTFNGGGGMRFFLSNEFFIDGSAFESPSYNRGHYVSTESIANVLNQIVELQPDDYRNSGYPLLSQDPKHKYMYDFNIKYGLIGRTYAHVGDSGGVASTGPLGEHPCSTLQREDYVPAFAAYPDCVDFARVLWDPGENKPIAALKDKSLRDHVTAILEREGADFDQASNFLDGYGHAILRSGRGQDKRALWLRWGECYGHRHDDMLTIGYEARRRVWLPELGYPHSWTFRHQWEGNRLTHYGAHIVGEPHGVKRIGGGRLLLFADGGWAKVACADARSYKAAPAPELYETVPGPLMARTVALIDLSEQDSYAVSIFRLRGGSDHYVSFHGPRGQATADGIDLAVQEKGTLAGPDIEYGKGVEWDKANPKLRAFPYFYGVRRGASRNVWRLEWDLDGFPELHLRMHALDPEGADVALVKGRPPGGGRPYELQWAIRHVHADRKPLNSAFAAVIEAYQGRPLISRIRRLNVSTQAQAGQPPVAFEVICGDRVDTIIQCHDPSVPVTTSSGLSMTGSFGVWSEVNGKLQRAFLVNGGHLTKGNTRVEAPSPSYCGTAVSTDFTARKIVVQPRPKDPQFFVGRHARIANDSGNDCSHLVVGARNVDGGVELELEYDPRIAEGPVAGVADSCVRSAIHLILGRQLYYHGKTLSNEDTSRLYKVSGVSGANVFIDTGAHGTIKKETLAQAFVDKGGDGPARFFIYDYGPGDTVTMANSVSVAPATLR